MNASSAPIEFQRHPVQRKYRFPGTYVAPTSWHEALARLADDGPRSRLVAGGTDLILEIGRGARTDVDTLVDLRRIPGTADIVAFERDGRPWARLGPLVTHNDVITNDVLVAGALPLAQACLEVASPQLRNRATVVGNVVTASPANDTLSALIALDARVVVRSVAGSRSVPVTDFVTGFRRCDLGHGEAVSALEVPLLDRSWRGIFAKVGNRSAQAISIVHLATVVRLDEAGVVVEARVAIGSVAERVLLFDTAAALLVGRSLDTEAIDDAVAAAVAAVTPIDDLRATADYRRSVLAAVLRRSLQAVADNRQAATWPARAVTLREVRSTSDHSLDGLTIERGTTVTIEVNGSPRTGPPATTLLDWLRTHGELTGTKEGCAEGECGACTVNCDGAAVLACLVPTAQVVGSSIGTVEALGAESDLHPLQQAFIDCSAAQCGFCTPGFLLAAERLLAETPVPDRRTIERGLAGNLCRCTGYVSIIEAVLSAIPDGDAEA